MFSIVIRDVVIKFNGINMNKILLFLLFLFSINTQGQFTKIYDFLGAPTCKYPNDEQLCFDGTFLYGIAGGGSFGYGTIYKIKPDGTNFTKIYDFDGVDNIFHAYGALISDGVFLYGTAGGGLNNAGIIFKIKPDGTSFNKLYDFGGAYQGGNPIGFLFYDGTFFYGMTEYGGLNGHGTIYKIKADGSGYTKLFDFNQWISGMRPVGSFISDGTFLYGMTQHGGTYANGTIFKIKPDGTGYIKLLDFRAGFAPGEHPMGALISDGTFLYGMTSDGGANQKGEIFKIKLDGTDFSVMHSFDYYGVDGWHPTGSLVFDGTFFYGLAIRGLSQFGTIFRIRPNGTDFSNLINFDGVNYGQCTGGAGSLISDGNFFYASAGGGSMNLGTIYKIDPSGLAVNIEEFSNNNISIYPNPSNTSFTLKTSEFIGNTISVYNILGEEVYKSSITKPITKIFVNDLGKTGIYLVKIMKNSTQLVSTSKLMIAN